MINAIKKLNEARNNYNPETGDGANEYLNALLNYLEKSREVDNALEKVKTILDKNKNKNLNRH